MRIFAEPQQDNQPATIRTLPWLDASLNGGLRPGAAYMVAGAPGSNKATMLAQVLSILAQHRVPSLLVLTEQSRREVEQVFERVNPGAGAELRGRLQEYLGVIEIDDISQLPNLVRRRVPERFPHTRVIVVDSIQGAGLASTATRTYQRVFEFVDEARARGITTCLTCHVTKRGAISGPRSLEHKADVVFILRKALGLRQLFIAKNRFGPEIVEPILLTVSERGLSPSPHAAEATSAALGFAGEGDELLEIQAAVSLPKLGGRGELNCPFLPAKRVKQILSTLSSLPGIEVGDLSYSINAYIPNARGYAPAADLPLALAIMSAYSRRRLPTDTVFAGQLDLRRTVRSATASYLRALASMLSQGAAPNVRRVVLSSACVGLFNESFGGDLPRPVLDVIGVGTLDQLLSHLWPGVLAQKIGGAQGTQSIG